ncbi:hypothetical protein [Hymenobacter koreensis]|uniref:Lipocalin-like domain-containing protein n=1 Tax=Hymenobacter koreensis TaxID=1084523 RepID=A0ABP8JH91_9BACT
MWGTKLYYTDFLETPVRYTLTPTTFTMYDEGLPRAHRLLKLTKDSLVYVNQEGYVARLYKRRK